MFRTILAINLVLIIVIEVKKMFRTFFSKKDVNSPELWLNVHSTDSTKVLHIFDGVETSLLLAEWFLSMVRLFIIP